MLLTMKKKMLAQNTGTESMDLFKMFLRLKREDSLQGKLMMSDKNEQ